MREFDDVQVIYIPRECNHRVDHMAKVRSRSKPPIDLEGSLVTIRERSLPLIQKRGFFAETCTILMEEEDWRTSIINFLSSPSQPIDKKTRIFKT